MVYQASHGMVHFISGERFDLDARIVASYEIDLSDEQFDLIVGKCIDLAGIKYGHLQLLGMGLERITGIRNPFRDGDKSFVCSELVGFLIQLCEGTAPLDLELAGPKQLEVWVAALSNARKTK
jgi:hypothetical protein